MNYALVASVILFVATFVSWLLIKLNYADKSKQVKWALFVLFFWLLNFLQLIFLAFYYQLNY
ncbi:hypothetical protein [methanotrophic endosymbiont of Bathymodiolus puteoserpentis (Logatchev)]|jgi:hypothetical protein|uniref:hypothetical protein n=1 Tax=methanotrophic endosymbiont of Bathymodiolus puteoserpentis (Logatchev) TaxID=343235 RepID=UPI0013CAA4CE|nr:hypothetical protein [methanotrophic endosymbiont of Bathymodiolus puteoserpentis (Logatchev)]SHE20482.1 hypothetical protein BPUTEOMOX_316 [methanotrophic endosymbiont of Bathymodiolus puteoserpentis (Logatchev)]